ncbi:AI-2E family transporter [Macrococcus brunensis]|uniref:AI-2E family transporter n=1 Tax=Macrococcus brunensis TaxID=198483 RepID=UPI001EF01024|nr:AI-2E family transporter [Macrococcus brunensis]ULG70943.1 AI-2E family transporter [Macrococcus brunensis]ULG73277.1 AI-2E family transporter [Macrococcus brunensis]
MFKNNRFISFLGGATIIYTLLVAILIGILIFITNQVSFIFDPVVTIVKTIIGPIIVAFIFFYLLNPVVNFLEKYRIKRLWGIILLIVIIIGVLVGTITLLVPLIQEQLIRFINHFPSYVDHLGDVFNQFTKNSFIEPYMADVQSWINNHLATLQDKANDYMDKLPSKFRSIIDTLMSVIIVIGTFPFVLFFLLKDGDKFLNYVLKLTPPKYRQDVHDILLKMDIQVGSYIQGQLIVSLCIGVLLFIGYNIIGLEYALVLASIAAVTSVVPYLGPTIAISPAIVIALVDSPFTLLKLAIVWVAVQFLEGHFISPNIMGKTMQIHPLTIIFVLLCAGNLAGVLGVILAIPAYAIIRVIISHLFDKFKKRYNRYFSEDSGPYDVHQ